MSEERYQSKELYKSIVGRKYVFIGVLSAMCLITLVVDISTGPANLSLLSVFSTIVFPGQSDSITYTIVWVYRLPMALTAIVIGAALSIAGAEMQTILDNPLASPYTLGVSAGAGFGAALALVLGVGITHAETFLVPLNAFLFAMLTCFLILFISRIRGVRTETMVLAGIALLFLFNSLLALLQYMASEEELQAVVFWLFGSLIKASWPKLTITAGILLFIFPLLLRDAWKLTALRLGDEKAKSLGIDVERLKIKVFVFVSVLAAAAVCFVGTIGFVGLVGPHIARMVVGEDQRFFLLMSALAGALLLSTASIASKMIIPGVVFPIGIITSFIGVPFFLSLILRKRRVEFW